MDMETFSKKTLTLNRVLSALVSPTMLLLIVFLPGCVFRPRTRVPQAPAALACSVSPSEVLAGEPIVVSVSASNFPSNAG